MLTQRVIVPEIASAVSVAHYPGEGRWPRRRVYPMMHDPSHSLCTAIGMALKGLAQPLSGIFGRVTENAERCRSGVVQPSETRGYCFCITAFVHDSACRSRPAFVQTAGSEPIFGETSDFLVIYE